MFTGSRQHYRMTDDAPYDWHRAPRRDHDLDRGVGVYALFLNPGSALPGIEPPAGDLLYIGKACGAGGFLQRCHFLGTTRNHSPRKSLAVLLMEVLSLVPVRVDKPRAPHTWTLDEPSEARLTSWMYSNLALALEHGDDPDGRESELVARYAPPLNLAKCCQSEQHQHIALARKAVWIFVAPSERTTEQAMTVTSVRRTVAVGREPNVVVDRVVETAEEMAVRYGLLAKSFRSSLRRQISWYKKPQIWEFPVGSREHLDMEEVAARMTQQHR